MREDGYTFKIENHTLLAYKDGVQLTNTWENDADMNPIGTYDVKSRIIGQEGTAIEVVNRRLNIFYTDRIYSSKATSYTVTKMVTAIQKQQYVINQFSVMPVTAENEEAVKTTAKYIPSFVLLHKNGVFSYIYKNDSTTLANYTAVGYNWNKFENTEDLFADLLNNNITTTKDVRNLTYVNEVMGNWKQTYDKAFAQQKVTNFWFVSGIFYAIFFGLTAFMGLMLWLLCRGKNNPNRGLKIYTCEGIAGWICVCPGLLAMIVGFIFTAAQQVAFIVLIGLRAMWLAMRQLNPKY